MTTPADQSTGPTLQRLIAGTRHLFLDFDGPICAVFAGTPSSDVAEQLRRGLKTAGFTLPTKSMREPDPLELFRIIANSRPDAAATAQQLLITFEIEAAATARPTPGAADLIITAHRTGRTITIVSNNSSAAITAYLADRRLTGYIREVCGRDAADPDLMKPNPAPLRQAVSGLHAHPRDCTFIGDTATDVITGRAADIPVIGYANKPGKVKALADAGAAAVTTDLAEITMALRVSSRAVLPN